MRFEIVVAPQPSEVDAPAGAARAPAPPAAAPPGLHLLRRAQRRATREQLDVFVDGANVTARIRESHGAFVLRDLALALCDLGHRPRGKATVRFYDEPWEICVERFGPTACLSVYRAGPEPLIAVYDRAVPFDDVVGAARDRATSPASSRSTASRTEARTSPNGTLRSCTATMGSGPARYTLRHAVAPKRSTQISHGSS